MDLDNGHLVVVVMDNKEMVEMFVEDNVVNKSYYHMMKNDHLESVNVAVVMMVEVWDTFDYDIYLYYADQF